MDRLWLSFKHRELEDRYKIYHAEHMRSLDVRSSVLSTITYAAVLFKAYEVHAAWSCGSWCWAVVHTLVLAPAPAVWALAHRRSWAGCRRLWLAVFVPYSFQMARFVTRTLNFTATGLDAPFFFWSALNYSNVGWQLALALCYRLPFTYHLPTHLAALAWIQLHNSDWCRWVGAARPAALGLLRHIATLLALPGTTSSAAARGAAVGAEALTPCRELLAFGQLYLGLGLGSVLVWLLERQSRHTFLLQMSAGTASVTPPPLLRKAKCWALLGAVLAAPAAWTAVQLAVLLLGQLANAGAVAQEEVLVGEL